MTLADEDKVSFQGHTFLPKLKEIESGHWILDKWAYFDAYISQTMHMWLSIAITLELSKVFFKNKGPVSAHFLPKFENSTSGWSKTLKRFQK